MRQPWQARFTAARTLLAAAAVILLGVACGDDDVVNPQVNQCATVALPLSAGTDAPTVTDVGLEVQTSGIVIVATVTDPQGGTNLQGVVQTIGVFEAACCCGSPIELQDDIADSGVEETFGTVVLAVGNPHLYAAIAASTTWPAEVEITDLDGNKTTGRVMARIIH